MFLRILKAEYNRRSLLKPLFWENTFKLPLEDVYTRLSIISRGKLDFQLESGEVNMYDIFKTLNKGEDAMVLVEGSPGIGKTTFCLKISYDWTNLKIPNESSFPIFELVLLLKCRDIHGDIMEAISEQLLPEGVDEKVRKEIMDYIKDIHNQEKILIILDGLDELPKTAKPHVDKLLYRRYLPFCYVLATSRQERGIVVRQEVNFSVLYQIEGFTEQDAFEYIRKHFCHSGSKDLSNGEKLIEAIQENVFLHALPNNPLNLLLLCVVFEDHQGELPSFRTELYQIIIRCLLRRYCAKHNLEAPGDDQALEKLFEESLLVLGELAWRCLLEDRFSFREDELAKFERKIKDLAARELGLVFKEASMKKINPQHEYHFFHKTFQEYLAATYLAFKLLKELNLFIDLKFKFSKITLKYRQVFLFVSGILGKDATVLFRKIGTALKSGGWDWHKCSKKAATFFTESFSESRNAEQMAMTLCSFIPFPLTVEIKDWGRGKKTTNMLIVAEACRNFPQLQHPVHLTIETVDTNMLKREDLNMVAKFLVSCPKLQTFSFYRPGLELTLYVHSLTALFKGLSRNSTLCSFTFRAGPALSSDQAVISGDSLAANKTLTTVTFELIECNEAWTSALEKGLSADTPLSTVVLEIYGSLSAEAKGALKRVLFSRSLASLTLIVYGEMHDSLATSVGESLATESILKSLTLIIFGKVSYSGATSLARGFLENSFLNSLDVKVFGELPDNWVTVTEKVLEKKKTKMSVAFHPNITGTISKAQVTRLCPGFELQSLTLNLWGELSCTGADTLCNLLITSSTSCVTLNIHGKVTDNVAECLVSYLKSCKTLSSLGINVWGELTRGGSSALQELSCNGKYSVALNVCSVASDPWICKDLNDPINVSPSVNTVSTELEHNCSIIPSLNISNQNVFGLDRGRNLGDGLTKNMSLTSLNLSFSDFSVASGDQPRDLGDDLAKNSSLTTLSLTFNNFRGLMGDWARGLGDGLANNTSLTTLSLTLHNCRGRMGDWARDLGDGLANNTSLTTLSLTFNNCMGLMGDWVRGLGDGLANNTSLTALSLTFKNCGSLIGDWIRGLGDGLANNTSLTTLSLTLHNCGGQMGDWARDLVDGLVNNTSLTTLSLTFNNCMDLSGDWARGLGDGLANNTSLTALSLTVNNSSDLSGDLAPGLGDGLANSTSLTTLNLTIDNYIGPRRYWTRGLGDGLAKNKPPLTIPSLTFNNCSNQTRDLVRGLGDGLAKNTSLTKLSLTINPNSGLRGDWTRGLRNGLAKNKSLTTLSLTFNNCSDQTGDLAHGLGDGLAKNTSLTKLSLTINKYSGLRGDWTRGLRNGLAKNKSLTTLSLTFNNCSDQTGDLAHGLGDGLAKNTSLTKLSLTINNYSGLRGDWTRGLGDGLAKNTSLTKLSLKINNYSGLRGDWACGLGDGLANNTSLTTLSLKINNHSDLRGDWTGGLGDWLVKNTSLIKPSLTFSNCSDLSGDWTRDLGHSIGRSKSLKVVNVTVTTLIKMSEEWVFALCNSLAESDTITALKFTFNDHSGTSEVVGHDLRKCFVDCKSSPSLHLTVSLYGEAVVS